MHPRVRQGLLVLPVIAAFCSATQTRAQAPAATKAAPASPTAPSKAEQVVAVVNGENITRGDLIGFLSQYQIPSGSEDQIYKDAVESLVNAKLINQYLIRQKLVVSEDKLNERIVALEKELKARGTDLPSEIIRSGMSLPEIRKQYANRLRWEELLNERGRDSELNKFFSSHKDLFSGTQVKASHILIKLDPTAAPDAKAKVREKLLAIKKDILDKKIGFAESANKNSEDPANSDGAGGDIGYFTLNGTVIEEFSVPAFAMKKGDISDPIETPYGLHLITVTDRKDGAPIDFEQNKPLVKRVFESELQKTLLTAERKAAKVEVKPMPADLFEVAPGANRPAPATPNGAPTGTANGPESAKPGTAK